MFLNAVFQGGGVKGIALVGALHKIEELNIKFNAVSGTSAGSIVAALYAAGYTTAEMKKILEETDLNLLLDPFRFKKFAFFRNKGFYKGQKLYDWVFQHLKAKNIVTFSDLNNIELKIIASDLTNRELLIFDHHTFPKMNIAEAVRMSSSIPLFFSPISLGERLVVDGGVLSNYPLFTFNDPDNTLGFKLVANSAQAPQTPKNFAGYIKSLIGTMLDAHDKEDENRLNHNNVINIDDAGISATKFNLTNDEKKQLFQNGYYAASKFINDNSTFFEKVKNAKLVIEPPIQQPFVINIPDNLQPDESIRLSISTLFKICVDGKYLLIKGGRIDQYQPVGGVLKRFESHKSVLRELSVLDDDKFPIDETSRDDLRIRVPYSSLAKFLEWYRKEIGREISPWREFYEELIHSEILPFNTFRYINYEHLKTHLEGIKFSTYFGCHELLIAEIYELIPTQEQFDQLRNLQNTPSDNILWCEKSLILSKGFDNNLKRDVTRISESSGWIL
jgi:NTE family protein